MIKPQNHILFKHYYWNPQSKALYSDQKPIIQIARCQTFYSIFYKKPSGRISTPSDKITLIK